MRRISLVLVALLLGAILSFAAEGYNPQVLQKLGFSTEQINQLISIQDESRITSQKAQAEIAIAKAELAKLLLNPDASMKDVEKSIRAAMEWETQIKLAQVQRELKIRKLIGDKKWREMMLALRQRIAAAKHVPPKAARGAERGEASQGTKAKAMLKKFTELMRGKGK